MPINILLPQNGSEQVKSHTGTKYNGAIPLR